MNKLILTFIASAIYFLSYSQSFHKNALVFDAKLGIDVYNTKYYYQLKSTGQDTTTEDKAANRNFSFGLEYGVLDRLGVGVRAKFNRYFAGADEITGKEPYHTSLDYMATVNFHAVKNKVLDLALGFNIGGSKLNQFDLNAIFTPHSWPAVARYEVRSAVANKRPSGRHIQESVDSSWLQHHRQVRFRHGLGFGPL